MNRHSLSRSSSQRGFTLLELMVVIIILGILAAIAYPTYQRYARDSRLQHAKADMMQTQNMLEKYYAQRQTFLDKDNKYPANMENAVKSDFFDIGFYTDDDLCKASPDSYCLYAVPTTANSNETRFLFVEAGGSIQTCEIGTAAMTGGVLSNKQNATNCRSD